MCVPIYVYIYLYIFYVYTYICVCECADTIIESKNTSGLRVFGIILATHRLPSKFNYPLSYRDIYIYIFIPTDKYITEFHSILGIQPFLSQ